MKTDTLRGRDFLSTTEFTNEEIDSFVDVASDLKRRFALGEDHELLHNKTLFMVFYNISLRTRTAFEAGMTQLGGHAIFLRQEEIYSPLISGEGEKRVERISDTARVLSRIGHGIAVRCYGKPINYIYGLGNEIVREYAQWADIPVINMEDDFFHPCQAMGDLLTIKEKLGDLRNKKFVMSWASSPGHRFKELSVAHSNLDLTSRYGMNVVLAHPKGFELDEKVLEQVKRQSIASGGSFTIVHDMTEALDGADVVYAKSWTALDFLPPKAREVDEEGLKNLFEKNSQGWTVDANMMRLANPGAIYMHNLPCNRGYEVTDEVIDGPQSAVFDQAENRMHSQKAILTMVMR